ncbi:hypothetical protein AUEXF2481DRAFT_204920 [Aureobasidium subglaciale EXF-2481]|uniref:Ubiquitin-like protein ATG12 n=1 Tax=Aureobasidium subglaciale (strain EXF-2481) TaxID=1043005 RepID=A0A074ZNK2_AURSE|nr:uncharacterized protein AUEXF2481DRAFT_204920 [Aureobasidium subglaciale EXF-2481]KEQ99936.1 hypothetical protein AUEXF2481DRAFT_204920 [Aureobasidium subglaciale EXF-2481]
MSSSPPPDMVTEAEADEEESLASNESPAAEMPMTMAASMVLDHLPLDAHNALSSAGMLEQKKIHLRFRPGPGTPSLPKPRVTISSTHHFDWIVRYLRRQLRLDSHQSVFCYVNQVFAPGMDEQVGNLWRCFRTGEDLIVSYAVAPAFG